jgi:tetratricopeptide (TPR) repeat protein
VVNQSGFSGEVVVFTGKLSLLGRKDARALVTRLGGETADEVTARTTLLVVGAERAAGADPAADDGEKSRKLRKAEQVNARDPGRVRIVEESEFCARAGMPAPAALRQQFYALRDVRAMYPGVREDYLRYLEQWGLIRRVVRTNADTYFGFPDLAVIKLASAELEQGRTFRSVLRSLVAARAGQLTFDFRPTAGDAHPAKVVALRHPSVTVPTAPRRTEAQAEALGTRFFLEGSALDDGDEWKQDQAMTAYRKALEADPYLVPAIVNLANIHYARDELVEAQALYERAIGLDDECFEGHFNLGNIYHDLGRFEDAQGCYRRALVLNDSYADAHFYLAVTLEKMGRSHEAKPHWRAYQQLAPDGEWVELAKEFSE